MISVKRSPPANTDTAVGGCGAGSGADTIVLTGDVNLTAALPGATSEIEVAGGGFTVARTAASEFRIFGSGRPAAYSP